MDTPAKCRSSKTFIETMDSFSDDTSLHGFRNAVNSKFLIYRRLLWALILLAAIAGYLYLLVGSVSKYYNYTSHTKFTRNATVAMDFPAVSICEQNVFPKSILTPVLGLERFVVHYQLNTTDSLTEDERQLADSLLEKVTLGEVILSSGLNVTGKHLLCMFDGLEIPCHKYITPMMSEESLCFTFQLQQLVNEMGRLQSRRPGYKFGLNILLGIDRDEYLISAAGGVGLKVLIHEPHVYPRVNEEALSIQAGVEAYMSMEQIIETVLGKPYSSIECIHDEGPIITHDIEVPKYSYEACMLGCMLKRSFGACNCSFGVNETTRFDTTFTDKQRFCTMKDYYSCIRPRFSEYQKTNCGCLHPCESVRYSSTLSTLYFPSPMYVAMAENKNWKWQTEEELHKNVVNLYVYYRAIQYTSVEQVPSYTYDVLIADLGGLLGLFVGASLITVLELLEFLFLLAVRKGVGTGRQGKVHEQEGEVKSRPELVKTRHK